MGLNIKNERTHALVRDLAGVLGSTQTQAVEEAVQAMLEAKRTDLGRPDAGFSRIEALITEIDGHFTDAQRAQLTTGESELYDEDGLPR